MEPARYRVRCRCKRCGHIYRRIIKKLNDPDPPCPKKKCKEAIAAEQAEKMEANVEEMIETGETPGHVGANVTVKAIDETAKIVMEDYQMTDLKDNVRQGESMVPALTPRQAAMSKNFWGGGRMRERRNPTFLRGIGGRSEEMKDMNIGQKAINGAFSIPDITKGRPADTQTGADELSRIHRSRYRPPVNIILDANKEKK